LLSQTNTAKENDSAAQTSPLLRALENLVALQHYEYLGPVEGELRRWAKRHQGRGGPMALGGGLDGRGLEPGGWGRFERS
jgi:hypothetical protein